MKIVVCAKQVPDTNEVRIDQKTGTLIREGVPAIMNPDDKAGLEAALQIKDKTGAEVTVITMGLPAAEEILREAFAMGADKGVLVTDRPFGGADTLATSNTLAAAIKTLDYDLIIAGRQAIDGDTAQVGPQIAEHLDIPNISYVQKVVAVTDDSITVERQYDDGYHVEKAQMPCLITALGDLNKARYMTPGGIFDAFKKDIQIITRKDVDIEDEKIGKAGSPTNVAKSFPKAVKAAGEKVELDADAASEYLVGKLKEKHII